MKIGSSLDGATIDLDKKETFVSYSIGAFNRTKILLGNVGYSSRKYKVFDTEL